VTPIKNITIEIDKSVFRRISLRIPWMINRRYPRGRSNSGAGRNYLKNALLVEVLDRGLSLWVDAVSRKTPLRALLHIFIRALIEAVTFAAPVRYCAV
jgi:hypothetical protein